MKTQSLTLPIFAIFCLILTACTPKIQLETPAEGITINMNVVVDHQIAIKMNEEAKAVLLISENEESKIEDSENHK